MKGYRTIYKADIGGGDFEFEILEDEIEVKDSDRRDDDYASLILNKETYEVEYESNFIRLWGKDYIWRVQEYIKEFPLI